MKEQKAYIDDRGSALLLVLLLIMVTAAVSTAYLGLASSDVARSRDYNRYKQAMGVAEAGMDKAVLELKNAVFKYGAPNEEDLEGIAPPDITGFTFTSPAGDPAFLIQPDGEFHHSEKITEGRWAGMYGDYQRYELRVGTVRAGTDDGVVLTQNMQCLAIPVFQFGVFYDEDLEILPGPKMVFAGPVHTNGKLFVACDNLLQFDDLVTVQEEIYRNRKDKPTTFPGGDVMVKNGNDEYKSMNDDDGPIDHNRDNWPVASLQRWDGRMIDSAHEVPEMKLPIPAADQAHDIIERADPDNDDPRLLESKFETKADIKIWQDDDGGLHGELADGSDFPLVYGNPPAIGGKINLNPNNSADNEFVLVKADGTQITRDDLKSTTKDWAGEATLIHVKPKGNGNQNGFIVDGESVDLKNSETYDLQSVDTMQVRLYNDKRKNGKAIGQWWIAPTSSKSVVKVENQPLGNVVSVVDVSEFGDWREGEGSPRTMQSLDIDVEALAGHPDFPVDGAVVYTYNEAADDGETGVIRLVNGAELPAGGLTVATPDPIYIKGDYNTEGLAAPSLVAGDAVNILSNGWSDANSWKTLANRKATQTQVKTVVMTGNTDSHVGSYNGGLENVLRFLETWSGVELKFRGSIVCFWNSETATGSWVYGNNRYEAPIRNWGYDEMYRDPRNAPPGIPNVIALEALKWSQDRWTDGEIAKGEKSLAY